MTIRHSACSCGQFHLEIEGRTSAHLHVAVISNRARYWREQITFAGKSTTWEWTAESGCEP